MATMATSNLIAAAEAAQGWQADAEAQAHTDAEPTGQRPLGGKRA